MVLNKRTGMFINFGRFSHPYCSYSGPYVYYICSYKPKEMKMLVFLFIWIKNWQIKWKQITKVHSNCKKICIFFFQLYCTISKLILTSLEIMKNVISATFSIKEISHPYAYSRPYEYCFLPIFPPVPLFQTVRLFRTLE